MNNQNREYEEEILLYRTFKQKVYFRSTQQIPNVYIVFKLRYNTNGKAARQ